MCVAKRWLYSLACTCTTNLPPRVPGHHILRCGVDRGGRSMSSGRRSMRIFHEALTNSTMRIYRHHGGCRGVQQTNHRAQSTAAMSHTPAPDCLPLIYVRETAEGVEVRWQGDHDVSLFHYEWLYRNRPENMQSSGQNTQSPLASVPEGQKEASLSDDGHTLCLKWSSSSENGTFATTYFPATHLRNHRYTHTCLGDLAAARRTMPLCPLRAPVTTLEYKDLMASEAAVRTWLETLARDGLCVLHGVPIEDGQVVKVGERCGPVMTTIYGTIWDVKVDLRPINIAYSNVALDLHQDLVYYESPPGLQLLHCLRFDASIQGGATTFVDVFAAAEALRTANPAAFKTLTEVPATFQKIHYDRERPVHLIYRRPHISLNSTADIIGVFWAPPFEGALLAPPHRVSEYYNAYREFAKIIEGEDEGGTVGGSRSGGEGGGSGTGVAKIRIRLQPGQLVVFNNRRMVHGRDAFSNADNAVRHLQGCYVSTDVFASRLRVLQNAGRARADRLPGYPIPRISDQDHS